MVEAFRVKLHISLVGDSGGPRNCVFVPIGAGRIFTTFWFGLGGIGTRKARGVWKRRPTWPKTLVK